MYMYIFILVEILFSIFFRIVKSESSFKFQTTGKVKTWYLDAADEETETWCARCWNTDRERMFNIAATCNVM